MGKKLKFVILGLLLFFLSVSVFIFNKNLEHKLSNEDFININDLSNKEIEDYYIGVAKLQKMRIMINHEC